MKIETYIFRRIIKKVNNKMWKYVCKMIYLICFLGIIGSISSASVLVSSINDVNVETKDEEKAQEEIVERKRVALTFDDGPSPGVTSKLLDALKERGVKATFFVIGENAAAYPELIKREIEEGHTVGNHTYTHVNIKQISLAEALEELEKTNKVIEEISGVPVEYMRPPFGEWDKEVEKETNMIPVLWSVDTLDWTTENVDEIVNRVVTDISENDIILLHDCYESSVNAVIRIIDILQAEGYEFVTVEELILN